MLHAKTGEVIEWEEVTSEENIKVVQIRKEVQMLREEHEELEAEPRPDIVGEFGTEIKHQLMQLTEEKLEEKGNVDKVEKVAIFQQRTQEEEKYTGTFQEVSTEHRTRRMERVKKIHETVSEESEILSEETMEELQEMLLEVKTIEKNIEDIEKLNLGLQELQALQWQVELAGQQQGERDDWYLLLDRTLVEASSAPGALEEIESQTTGPFVVEEVEVLEDKWKWEEEKTSQVKESRQYKIHEQSQKEVDDKWFAILDVPPKEKVPSGLVYDHEVTREETGPVMEQVTSVKTIMYEEKTEERRGGMVETSLEVLQKNPVVQQVIDNWFVLLDPVSFENRTVSSVPVAEVYEDTVSIQEKKEIIEEKPIMIKKVQIKSWEGGEVTTKIPVGTREVDDSWFMHFDPTPFEKRSVATVPLTEVYEETVGLKTQQRLPIMEKEVTTEEMRIIIRGMKTREVQTENPVVKREVDDSWFVLFDQTPFGKRRVTSTAPLMEVFEDTEAVRTHRVTIKQKEIITGEHVILTEKRAIAGEVEMKMPVSRREIDDSWFVLFDPIPFEKRSVATVGVSEMLILEEMRIKEVYERRLREEERRKREMEERRPPPQAPPLRAEEHRRKVDDDWFNLLETKPKVSELLQEDRSAWRERKVEHAQIIRVKESVVVPKARPQPPVDQPLTSTPTAQPIRLTSPSYQNESLTRLTITPDVTQDITQESKMETESVIIRKRKEKKITGETIYIRHSILMLEDFDVTQEVVLKHHASVSELKRLFMEDIPISVPTEWEKRLSTHTPVIIPQISNGELALA